LICMTRARRERERPCSLVSRRSRGRIAHPRCISSSEKNHGSIRGNPQNRFARKSPSKGQKTGKFDYLSGPNHPAHSIVFKFFTDDAKKQARCLWPPSSPAPPFADERLLHYRTSQGRS